MATASEILEEHTRKLANRPKLTERLALLITEGVKNAGTYNPADALLGVEERMTGKEYKLASAFLQWCHDWKMVFGNTSIRTRWNEYHMLMENRVQETKAKAESPVFLVTVTRVSHATREFRVTGAKNDVHALQVAQDKAGNFTFSEKDAEYVVDGVIEIPADQPTSVEEIKA